VARPRSAALLRTAALARRTAASRASEVSISTIALKRSALLKTLAEPILAAGGLADGEIGRGPRRRRLPFRARQRRTNQGTMNGPFLAILIAAFFPRPAFFAACIEVGFIRVICFTRVIRDIRDIRLGGLQRAGDFEVVRRFEGRLVPHGQPRFVQFRSAGQALRGKRRRCLRFAA